MRIDLVIHAPGAGPLARLALPWLAGAIFGDDAARLAAAVRLPGARLCDRLAVIDAFGPNPNHPLADPRLTAALRDSLSAHAIATVTVLRPRLTSVQGIGGIAGGISSSAGFSGGFSGGFAGMAPQTDVFLYESALRQALGGAVRFQVVASLDRSALP